MGVRYWFIKVSQNFNFWAPGQKLKNGWKVNKFHLIELILRTTGTAWLAPKESNISQFRPRSLDKSEKFLFPEKLLGIVYNSLFMTAIFLLILMETFAFYRRSVIKGKNRSTPISAAILFALSLQLLMDFFLPKLITGPNYFVSKFFITILNFFILVPFITILTNDKIVSHVKEMKPKSFSIIFRPKRIVSPSEKCEPTSNWFMLFLNPLNFLGPALDFPETYTIKNSI
jgi:hypothetical protein